MGTGEAKHSKAAIPGEAQQEGSLLAETRRDDALRALAALLLQPQTLQLLRPDRERASISSSSDNDDPRRGNCLSTPPMAHSRADADANRNARVPVMADKATQYSPDRDRRPSDALHSDQVPLQPVSPQQLPQLCPGESKSAQGPVTVEREGQSAPEALEMDQLVTLRASLVDHIADAVAARLLDSHVLGQPSAEEGRSAEVGSDVAMEAQPTSAADAACTIQLVLDQGSRSSNADALSIEESDCAGKDSSEASPQPPAGGQASLEAVEQPSDPAETSHHGGSQQGTEKEQGTQTQHSSSQKESAGDVVGMWIEQWRGRLTQQDMEQAAQEVIAEELAQLLDSWDGAAGSLPSALHGLAQRRASPLPPAAAAAPDGAAPQGTPLQHGTPAEDAKSSTPPEDAKGSSHQLTAEDTARGVQQQHGPPAETLAGPSQEDAGGCSQQLERQVAAEEAARGVQQRVQELLLRQQAAAADPLLDAVLETLAEASLERLHARTFCGSPQPASAARPTTQRHRPSAGNRQSAGRREADALRQEGPGRRGPKLRAGDAVPRWGTGLWQLEQAQRAGDRQAKPDRGDRAKSLERLKRRRQTAQRRDALTAPSDAAVQTSGRAGDASRTAEVSARPEQAPEAGLLTGRRPHMARAATIQGPSGLQDGSTCSWGSSDGQHSRPASPELQEQHRSRAWSEEEDEGPQLRLLQRPQPPDGPRLHGSLPGTAPAITQCGKMPKDAWILCMVDGGAEQESECVLQGLAKMTGA